VTLEDPDQRRVAIDTLIPISGDEPPTCDGPIVRMPMRRELGGIAEAVRRLDTAGVGIADIAVRRPTLDDVFMVLTGHAAEHENGEGDEQEPAPEREEAAA
jgi:ABC-2 type transport system ATP-binding protein